MKERGTFIGRFDWQNWTYGLFAGFIGGGAGAVVSGVVVSSVDPADFNFSTGKFYALVGTIFIANGLLNAFSYLHQNPLPKIIAYSQVTERIETTVTTQAAKET